MRVPLIAAVITLALAGCTPPHLGCHIGTHRAALGPDLHLGPDAPGLLDKLRGGAPIICAASLKF